MDELKNHILPELLVGIKDTNDDVVCATLRALADIVPVLGAAAVIGGNRGRLFTDGRPNKIITQNKNRNTLTLSEKMPVLVNIDENNVHLSERPSPDGGEDKKEKESSFVEDECTWSDWEVQETVANNHCTVENPLSDLKLKSQSNDLDADLLSSSLESSSDTKKTKYTKKLAISDITELDIKNSKVIKSPKEDFDFFTDMEPVIKKTQILHISEMESSKSMFDVKTLSSTLEEHDDNGWGEDLSDLNIDDTHELIVQ